MGRKDAAKSTGEEAAGGADEAVQAQTNRPENTKFKQQKLDAWQPILTPAWVIGTFILVGVVFVPVGAYLWKLSDDLFEAVVTYDSYNTGQISASVDQSACSIFEINEGYDQLQAGQRTFDSCTLTINFDRDLAEDEIVYVYYQIENFYQNHRRYVKSLSEAQLQNEININPVTTLSNTGLEQSCDPPQSFAGNTSAPQYGRIYYPCGLIALSVFNDGIALRSFERDGDVENYFASKPLNGTSSVQFLMSGTAWDSDLAKKYMNPTAVNCVLDINNPGGNLCPLRYFQYQYLWQTYDQFQCFGQLEGAAPDTPDPNNKTECYSYTEFVNGWAAEVYGEAEWQNFLNENPSLEPTFFGDGCAACKNSDDILVSAGGLEQPSNLTQTDSNGGLRNERFVVWMRTAGLPTFRKLLGQLQPPAGGFKQGDSVSFSVVPNFLVYNISGSKALVLGTTSPLGGKNDILGIAYMTVGAICLFLAALFGLKMKFRPRKLGDPQYLQWKMQ